MSRIWTFWSALSRGEAAVESEVPNEKQATRYVKEGMFNLSFEFGIGSGK